MKQVELVREYLPKADDRLADFILWEMTAYPICGLDHTRKQLAEIAAKCAPTHKRGWFRKLCALQRVQDSEMQRDLAAFVEKEQL